MTDSTGMLNIQPIHPFPARMAPSIVWENLPDSGKPMRIFDPMAGSGTTLVITKARGHQAIGCDTDPLAVMIARAWCADVAPERLTRLAASILNSAIAEAAHLCPETAYPRGADDQTQKFIDFWFDEANRIELAALSNCISQVENPDERNLLMTAFSRLIITKKLGVSLAMDVSHSRPHRKYDKAPVTPFNKFLHAVDYIARKAPFRTNNPAVLPAQVIKSDARSMPIDSASIDLIITSPPYLNAIDYIRGHKLSLVWMGQSIDGLRKIRSSNIGAEHSLPTTELAEFSTILPQIGDITSLKPYYRNMIIRYLHDMGATIAECRRVLRDGGRAIFVIGNSAIHGIHIKNSEALTLLAQNRGFRMESTTSRPIPESRRYLPPPNSESSGDRMKNRMREEVILTFATA